MNPFSTKSRALLSIFAILQAFALGSCGGGGSDGAAIPALLTSLSPGSTTSPGPTLDSSLVTVSWNAASGAALYTGGIFDIATGNSVLTITTSGTSASITLSPGKQYYWYVQACNSHGCSMFNTPYYFQTPAAGTPSGASYTIGGTVSGLSGSVVLRDNGGDNLTVSANGAFTFSSKVGNGNPYNATVLTQPAGQTCSVSTGAGTVSGSNVTNVSIVCGTATSTYSVGGSVSGLSGSLVLQDNNGDNLTVAASGTFTFANKLANGSPYSVTVLTHPASQSCSVTNGTGTIALANISNVVVTCAGSSYTIGGTVTGLSGSVVLQNNGGNNDTISTNGSFAFPATVAYGNTYNVTVLTQPNGQTCAVTSGGGTATTNVTSVVVACANTIVTPPVCTPPQTLVNGQCVTPIPPTDNSDCSTPYVLGRVLTIDVTNSTPGNPTTTSTAIRSYRAGADTTFLGQPVQQVIEQNVTGTVTVTSSIYRQDLATEWIELGYTITSSSGGSSTGSSTVSYQPPIHQPKQLVTGQTTTYSGQVIFPGGVGNTTLHTTVTFVRRESVTVPAGTFNACLFHADSTSSNVAGTGQLINDTWIAPNVGEVKSVSTSGTATLTSVVTRVQ